MMRPLAIFVGVLVLVAGLGLYALFFYPSAKFRSELAQAAARLPPGTTLSFGGEHFSAMSKTAELDDVTVRVAGDDPLELRIASVVIERPAEDFAAAWTRAVADPAALQPDQAIAVADRIVIRGVGVKSPSIKSKTDTMTIVRGRVYPWALLHPGLPSMAEAQVKLAAMIHAMGQARRLQQLQMQALQRKQRDPTTTDDPEQFKAQLGALQKDELEAAQPVARLQAAGVLGIGFDSADIDGVSAELDMDSAGAAPASSTPGSPAPATPALAAPAPSPAAAMAIPTKVGIRRYHMGSFDRGIGGDSLMEGFFEDAGPTKVSAERASTKGVAVRDPATRLIDGGPASLATFDGVSLGRIEMSGITVTLPQAGTMALKSAYYSDIAIDGGYLKSAAMGLIGLKITPANLPDPRSRQFFQQLNLSAVTLDVSGAYSWNAQDSIASFHDMVFRVDELGALTFSADVAGIARSAPAPFAQAALAGASIRYDDASLIERLLSGGGVRGADGVKFMRQQIAKGFLKTLSQQPIEPRKMAMLTQAVTDFSASPHTLKITLAPPSPVPFASFKTLIDAQWPKVIDELGLSVSAGP